jgi:hypothetical protein
MMILPSVTWGVCVCGVCNDRIVSELARLALRSVLSSRAFVRFCLSALDEVCAESATDFVLIVRRCMRSLYMYALHAGCYAVYVWMEAAPRYPSITRLTQTVFPLVFLAIVLIFPTGSESAADLVASLSPWSVHMQWMDVQLALLHDKRRDPHTNAEAQLADYLLVGDDQRRPPSRYTPLP